MDATLALRDRLETAEEENRQLRELLKPPTIFPAEWRLTPMESDVLAIISARAPSAMNKTALYEAMSFDDDDPPEKKIIDVVICKLRRKLAGVGVEIETLWGFGYRISMASRDRLRAAMAAPETAREEPRQTPEALDEISKAAWNAMWTAIDGEQPPAALVEISRDEDHSMSSITINGERIEASAVLDSEQALEEFVRRLWCAAAAVWPAPEEAEPTNEPAPKATGKRDGLSRVQQVVLALANDEPDLAVSTIASRAGCSDQSVYNARAKLRELGLME